MKKKVLLSVLLFAFCLVAGGVFVPKQVKVKADIIWEPREDKFFQENKDKGVFNYNRRQYTVVCDGDYVMSYESPLSDKTVEKYDKGTVLSMQYTYVDPQKRLWGVMVAKDYDYGEWILMDGFELVYDHREFCKDHSTELGEYDGRLASDDKVQNLIFWKYPNSGIVSFKTKNNLSRFHFSYLYQDENGKLWTYVSYFCCESGWVCIDDPEGTSLEPAPTTPVSEKPVVSPSVTKIPEVTPSIVVTQPVASEKPQVTVVPSTNPIVKGIVKCSFKMVNSWQGGYMGQIDMVNETKDSIKDWKMSFTCANKIDSLWAAELVEQDGEKVLVRNADWDTAIAPGETKSVNFVASGNTLVDPCDFEFVY